MVPASRRDVLRHGVVGGTLLTVGCSSQQSGSACEAGRTRYAADAPVSAAARWPMANRTARRTAYNPEASVPDEVSVYWRYTGCSEVESGVAVANERVFAGRARLDGTDGTPLGGKWTAYQWPAVVDNTLVIGSHTLAAYDAIDGSELWTFDPDGESGGVSPPAVTDDFVYITGNLDDRTVYGVALATGEEAWRFTPAADCSARLAVADDTVYAVDNEGTVYALAAETGDKRWEQSPAGSTRLGAPVVADSGLYLPTVDGGIVALDPADGSDRWDWAASDDYGRDIAVAEETVYVIGPEACHALATADGTERWSTDSVGGQTCSVGSESVVVGGDPDLVAISRNDGAEQWRFETRAVLFSDYDRRGISAAPALVDDIVYVATEASDVYALGPAE